MPGQKSARVLVAEANFINQEIIRALLGLLGLAPELDGYEATQRLRAAETGRARVRIIAMTPNAMLGDREKCLEPGMDDYISKPIDTVALVGILQRWLPVRD